MKLALIPGKLYKINPTYFKPNLAGYNEYVMSNNVLVSTDDILMYLETIINTHVFLFKDQIVWTINGYPEEDWLCEAK